MKINKSSPALRQGRLLANAFGVAPRLRGEGGFTVIELFVSIGIIFILFALAVAGIASALSKAQMNGTMNNARQLYLAQFSMANDGMSTDATGLAWVGDYAPALTLLEDYINKLVRPGYLKGGDVAKLLSAPGCNLRVNVNNGPPASVTFVPGTMSALKVHPVQERDPANTVFATSRNYVYDTAINGSAVPYGTKGFIVVRKGGDANVFNSTQATVTGWGNDQTKFQNGIGLKHGDNLGTVTPNDPASTLIY